MTRTDRLTFGLTTTAVMRGGASLRLKRLATRLAFVCLLCLAASAAARGQNIQFTHGATGSGADNSIQIAVAAYPGRGAAGLPITLNYSSRVWRLGHLATVNDSSYYTSITEAIYSEYSTAGWVSSLNLPKIEWPKEDEQYYYTGKQFCFICGSGLRRFRVARVYIHMPDGSTHELRQSDVPYEGALRVTGTFYAVDGSRLRYDSTSATTGTLYMTDGSRYVLNGANGQFIDRNGNVSTYTASTGLWKDTLGREIGLPFPANPQAQEYQYVPPGFQQDHPYRFIWKHLSDTGVLTPDPVTQAAPARKPIANNYLPNPSAAPTNFAGNNYPQWVQSSWGVNERPSLFISDAADEEASWTYVLGRGQVGGALFDPIVLTEVVLPTGLSYKFTYNIYGEIDKVVYPGGGFERFEYKEMAPSGDLTPPYTQANRSVKLRQRSPNTDGTDIAEWSYDVTPGATVTYAPDGSYSVVSKYNFQAPQQSGTHSNPRFWPFGFVDARQGLPYEERVYDKPPPPTDTGVMLRRTVTDYVWTDVSIPPRIGLPGEETVHAFRNARPSKEVSLVLDTGGDALAKKVTYLYGAADPSIAWNIETTVGLDRTWVIETQFTPVSQTIATTASAATLADSYTYPPASSTETTYLGDSAYRDRHILGLTTSIILRDAAGNPASKTETFYDELDLIAYTDLVGDPNYSDPGSTPGFEAVRGNPTTVRRYVNPSSTVGQGAECPAGVCLQTRTQFDQCGNPVYTWDERASAPLSAANVSLTKAYSSTYKHAYLTLSTTQAPDPSGQYGSSESFTTGSTYDPVTGQVTSAFDANGRVTTYSYDIDQTQRDPLNRLRKVTQPDGGYTLHDYHDAERYVRTEARLDASRSVNTYQYADGMGRLIRVLTAEGGGSYTAADTIYDKMGRAWKTSNIYRTQTLNGTVAGTLWTTTQFDQFGRVKSVTSPDGTSVTTAYERGVYTTVTDQAGKQRRQKADAQGRLVRVDEPGASGGLGDFDSPEQPSLYEYDALGNVVGINQGLTQAGANPDTPASYAQHRRFRYDALSRLTFEKQVEQEATIADPLTGQPTWSRRLAYDETIGGVGYRGLMTTIEDARHVVTHFSYDRLSRVREVTYTGGTPTISNKYDQPRTDAPPDGETEITFYNKGRLTEVTTAATTAVPQTQQLYDYDQMGRTRRQQQFVGTTAYDLRYGYNLGGGLVSERYPSGRTVSFGYDDAGRLLNAASGATTYASGMTYEPFGGLKTQTLGNGAVYSMSYTPERTQLASITLTHGAQTLQKYEYKYGAVNMATGEVDETKNDGQIARIEGTIGTQKLLQQRFKYDSLGRLASASEHHGASWQSRSYLLNYEYDLYGNRFQKAADNQNNPFAQSWVEAGAYNAGTNRFATGLTYDSAGNVVVDQRFRMLKFQYDANNRQKQSSSLTDTNVVQYVFDGTGQRVALRVEGVTTNVMVYDAFGALVAEYGGGGPSGSGTQYVMTDQQGSTRLTMRATPVNNELVLSRRDYLPFGEDMPGNVGPRAGVAGYGQVAGPRKKYAGMEQNEFTGMSHTLWREFDNLSARWTAPDPYGGSLMMSSPQSFNRYTYCNNDPVNQTDPAGLMAASEGWSSASSNFWGGDPGFNDPHFGGPAIIQNGEAGFPDRAPQEEENWILQGVIDGTDPLLSDSSQASSTQAQEQPPRPPDEPQGGPCDQEIARIFGDKNAIGAATGYEPAGLPEEWRRNLNRRDAMGTKPQAWAHLNGFSAHIYNKNKPGVGDVTLYVPPNFDNFTPPSGKDSVALFHYQKLGNQTDVTLAVYHVRNFSINRSDKNSAGSIRIGMSGGPGGDTKNYRHSHLEVHKGWGLPTSTSTNIVTKFKETMEMRDKTRVFFRNVFCK